MPTDPVEAIIAEALDRAGISYVCDDAKSGLDFAISGGPHIEVKRFHSKRIAEQMSRVENIIAIQGIDAARWFAAKIR